MPRSARLALGVLCIAGIAFAPPAARAGGWQEAHQVSDDVRIDVAPDGAAHVVHHLRYRVVAGKFKAFEVPGIDPRATLTPDTTVLPEKGGEIPAHVEPSPKTPGTLRVTFDEPKGLGRGLYVVDVAYAIDLVATKMITLDGAMWRVAWTAPAAPIGHDGARVVFALPSAPTEPRLASSDAAATTLATLKRSPATDELELVRAHVPRGEAVTWAIRVDPKALPRVVAPELRPRVTAAASAPAPDRVGGALVALAFAALAGVLAWALRRKQAAVAAACARAGVVARPLVSVPLGLEPFAYGAAGAAALAALLWWVPAWGAALVVVAMALAAHRAPRAVARPRGPGRWQHVPDADVLAPRPRRASPGDAFDLGTRAGKLTAAVVVAAVAALAFVLRLRVPGAAIAIPLAAAALAPLFVTGTRADLPAPPRELASRVLAPARDALARIVDLAHADVRCLARSRDGARDLDEVRLSCAPAEPIPGLRAIELAVAPPAATVTAAVPEVLVRFDDGSQAAAKVAQIAPGAPVVVGRAPEEKVLRLVPHDATPPGAARLVARLLVDLEERRAVDVAPARAKRYAGPERRVVRAPVALSGAAAST